MSARLSEDDYTRLPSAAAPPVEQNSRAGDRWRTSMIAQRPRARSQPDLMIKIKACSPFRKLLFGSSLGRQQLAIERAK